MFDLTATALFSRDKDHEKTWRIDMVPWSERNTEAFAGMHNQGKRILIIFDEASAIADEIWEVSEGALTDADTEIIWCCFGNPTQPVGRFRECFGKFKHRWVTRQIDSRTVKMTNKVKIQKWIDDYGEDHDFVRVRVRGVFPATAANALIGEDLARQAAQREYKPHVYSYAARVLAVDVARQGDDSSVIAKRQGLVLFPLKPLKIPDTMLIADCVATTWNDWDADGCFVDATGGYGVGVVDALRQTGKSPIEVYFNGKPRDPRYFNKRSEMYFEAMKWLKSGGAIPDDPELIEELCAHTYVFQGDKFRLCEKDEVKEIIGRSPDKADAFVTTFALPIEPRPKIDAYRTVNNGAQSYDPYANLR